MRTLLDVCAGIGGFSLAFKHLIGGFRTVGYIEIDRYCREVLRARIRERHLDDAPIFHDLRAFDGVPYRGRVDLITAGIECQPHSSAAHGNNRQQDLLEPLLQAIGEVEPVRVVLENTPGFIRDSMAEYTGRMAEMGYGTRWGVVSACRVGAPHTRDRVFALSHPDSDGEPVCPKHDEASELPNIARRFWDDWHEPMGMDDGLAICLDATRAAGRAVVPAVVAKAWEVLTSDND